MQAGAGGDAPPAPPPPSAVRCLQPPQVRFQSRVQMSCVAPNGVVDPRVFHILGRWGRQYTMVRPAGSAMPRCKLRLLVMLMWGAWSPCQDQRGRRHTGMGASFDPLLFRSQEPGVGKAESFCCFVSPSVTHLALHCDPACATAGDCADGAAARDGGPAQPQAAATPRGVDLLRGRLAGAARAGQHRGRWWRRHVLRTSEISCPLPAAALVTPSLSEH